jgi:hypothetical protein
LWRRISSQYVPDVLLGHDVHVLEVRRQRRRVDLALLLPGGALGEEQQPVAGPQHRQRLDHPGDRRDVVLEQWSRQRVDRRVLVGSGDPLVEVQEAFADSMSSNVVRMSSVDIAGCASHTR